MSIRLLGKIPKDVSSEKMKELEEMLQEIFKKTGLAFKEEKRETEGVPLLDTPEYGCKKFNYFVGTNENCLRDKSFEITYKETEESFEVFCNINERECGYGIKKLLNRIMTAVYLLCEAFFPGEIVCYDEKILDGDRNDDKKKDKAEVKQVEEMIIPALRWLKKQFPEKSFDNVIDFRTSETLFSFLEKQFENREDIFKVWECTSLLANRMIQSKKAYEIDGYSMEREDAFELVNDEQAVQNLDKLYYSGKENSLGLFFFLLCLQRELRRNFKFEGSEEKIEETVVCAANSIHLLRSGEENSEREWKKYNFPEEVILKLFEVEWEVIVDTLAFMSKLSREKVEQLTKKIADSSIERARKNLLKVKTQARVMALKLEAEKLLETKKYLEINNFVLNNSCYYWEWIDVLENEMPCKAEYAKQLKNIMLEKKKEETHKCRKEFLDDLLKKLSKENIYFTKKLYFRVLNAIECKDEIYAAMLTLKEVFEREYYDFKNTTKYVSFLENREVCERYLRF